MGMTKDNNIDAPVGDYDCWAATNKVRLVQIQGGRNAGELKAVVTVCADIGGRVETVETWHTLDPNAETSKGKRRINFTLDSFNAIGAVNALAEIGAALEANPACSEVVLSGVLDAEGKATQLATLHVSESNGYTNYDLWAKKKPAPKGLAAALSALGNKTGGVAPPKANPFAAPPSSASTGAQKDDIPF